MTAAKKAASPDAADSAEKSERSAYVVLAPLIQVTVGDQVLQFRIGDTLPALDEDEATRLMDLNLITKSE